MLHDNNNTHYIYNNRTRSDAIQLSPYIFQTKWFVIEAVINPGDARETCSHDRRCSCRDFVISAQTHAEGTTHLCAQFCTHKIAGFLHTRRVVCVCVCATDACSIWVCPNAAKCASVPLISIWCKSIEPSWWVLCFFAHQKDRWELVQSQLDLMETTSIIYGYLVQMVTRAEEFLYWIRRKYTFPHTDAHSNNIAQQNHSAVIQLRHFIYASNDGVKLCDWIHSICMCRIIKKSHSKSVTQKAMSKT